MPRDLDAERAAQHDEHEAEMPELRTEAELGRHRASAPDEDADADEWESDPEDDVEEIGRGTGRLHPSHRRGLNDDDDDDDDDDDEEDDPDLHFFHHAAGGSGAPPGGMSSLVARLLEEDMAMREASGRAASYPAAIKEMHPWATTLGVADVDACVALENAAFPPNMRASRQKLEYRLARCGELCFGLFTSATTEAPAEESAFTANNAPQVLTAGTLEAAGPVETSVPGRKAVLVAHIIATKSDNSVVHDADMEVPDEWRAKGSSPGQGHQEHGRTLQIHSLAVLPQYHGRGLGTMLLRAYLQRIGGAYVADRIALLAEDKLVPFYTREELGLINVGKSTKATFGGEQWNDLVLDLREYQEEDEESEDEEIVIEEEEEEMDVDPLEQPRQGS